MTRKQIVGKIKRKYGTIRHACKVRNKKESDVRAKLKRVEYNKKRHLVEPDIQWLINEFEI